MAAGHYFENLKIAVLPQWPEQIRTKFGRMTHRPTMKPIFS